MSGMQQTKIKKYTYIYLYGNGAEQVEEFKHLGSTITFDGLSDKEIKIRIEQAKYAFNLQKKLLKKKRENVL